MRIFLFHSANSFVVILGFVEFICSVVEFKPISISLLHLFQFIDIASQEFVIILRSPVKTWSLVLNDKTFMLLTVLFHYACTKCYIVICLNGRYGLFKNVEFYFVLLSLLIVMLILIYQERDFLHYPNGVLHLGFFM